MLGLGLMLVLVLALCNVAARADAHIPRE